MIRITRNTANDVVVTLTEKGTASNYLFEFQSKATRAKVYTIDQDTSAHPERYNKFTLTEVSSGATAADGELTLPEGEYWYTVYANSNSTNVDPTGLAVLEKGMAVSKDTEAADNTYTISNTYNVYTT